MAPAPPMSPQKRVTRARAAAKKTLDDPLTTKMDVVPKRATRKRVEAVEEKVIETETTEPTEPLRKSARRVATAAPTRRIKVTPLNNTSSTQQPPQQENEPGQPATKKPRATRSKKSAPDEAPIEEEKVQAAEPAKPKRSVAGKTKDTTKVTAAKVRGRPKIAEEVQDDRAGESQNPQRQPRTRAGSGAASTKPLTVAPTKTTVPKKKVTFEGLQEDDKENQPIQQEKATAKGKAAAPTRGIRAKPVRRPAAKTKANPRQNGSKATTEPTAQRVLTPKKVTQVAKSSSPAADSDEDELNGGKTPIRDLSQSPRRNVNIPRTGSPVKKLDFSTAALASSPVKGQAPSTLLSPARRPAPSPFKDALKESPKRGDFFKIPQVQKSFDANRARVQATPSSTTMLSQSPKRVLLDASVFPQSPSKSGRSPFKSSLLQSPPKRPISPVKASPVSRATPPPATPTQEPNAGVMSPDVAVSSHFRASQSPERSTRVHKMTPDEMAEEANSVIDFDQSVVDIRSPLKLEKLNQDVTDEDQEEYQDVFRIESGLKEDCVITLADTDSHLQAHTSILAEDVQPSQLMEDFEARTTAPTSTVLRAETPVNPASFLFRTVGLREDDESSEDELQSPAKIFQAQTPATNVGRKSRLSTINTEARRENPGFTPLAAQLSGWLASSPDKQPTKKHQQRSIFSPVAAQHVPGEVVIDRHSPIISRVSTEPKLSMSGSKSAGGRKSIIPRSSLTISMGGTPDKSTYFADEMAVKDLEEEVESMPTDDQDFEKLHQTDKTETLDDTLVAEASPEAVAEIEFEEVEQQDFQDQQKEQTLQENVSSTSERRSSEPSPEPEVVAERAGEAQEEPENSQKSTGSSAYGDENAAPTTLAPEVQQQVVTKSQQSSTTSAEITSLLHRAPLNEFSTPTRPQAAMPRFANTVVSKVPLRPEGDMSPIKVSKKRSRSLSAGPPSSVKKTPVVHASGFPKSSTVNTFSPAKSGAATPSSAGTTPGQRSFSIEDFGESTLDGIEIDDDDENLPPVTPTTVTAFRSVSLAATPSRTPKGRTPAAASSRVLQGAVVFVDVHTTEGADASGIFIELLTQMGAKCVKHWSWNPRASMGVDAEDSSSAMTPGSAKIGITHVVYKDGGKRTLEKVRDTEGVVKCVGVGWVLE
jgi:hypothetical protein